MNCNDHRVHVERSSRARRLHRKREGAAALEFALILPLFVFLVMGIIDFGHMLFVVNTITNAAREGARRGVVQRTAANIVSTAEAAATNYLSAASIQGATVAATEDGTDVVVTVTVTGYTPISGFSYNVPGLSSPNLAASRDLTAVSTMRWEFAPASGAP